MFCILKTKKNIKLFTVVLTSLPDRISKFEMFKNRTSYFFSFEIRRVRKSVCYA